MMFQLTQKSQRVLKNSRVMAKKLNSDSVGTEHLLAGIIAEESCVAAQVLRAMGFNVRSFAADLERSAAKPTGIFQSQAIDFSPRVRKVFDHANEFAASLGLGYIATEHILVGILKEKDCAAAQYLAQMGITEEKVMELFQNTENPQSAQGGSGFGGGDQHSFFGQSDAAGAKTGQKTDQLDKCSRDLTQLAKEGKLDPIIGRNKEIERVVQILSRRTKNNPVLIGEPGVGKTAIAEGLAERIVEGTVPETIADKRVVSLDLSSLVAGTKYRGDFEENLQKVLKEIHEAGDIILFIDEFHTLIGAGSAEGSMDAANILKPALSRGELQCIGATTLDEYRKHIEKDAALERRFQPVTVDEPSEEDTIAILHGLREKYENHHHVSIGNDAIEAAVKLSVRYISDRFLPDKAIDLVDEAASKVRIAALVAGPDLGDLETEIENAAKAEKDAAAQGDYDKAGEWKDRVETLKEQLDSAKKEWREKQDSTELSVGREDIADVVSAWTKIPVSRLEMDEKERLLHLEETLHRRLIGQDEAVTAVAGAIRRAGAGLKSAKRPIGSFIFMGPTGVGKTELAKALAEAVFGSEDAMTRIDMSEYMERHTVSRLVGAPPGYVGYEEGGQLTEAVRRNPYCVILLDEIEKAHSDVFNILLQVLDDGRLTDSLGHTVDFRNTIIIMTSNVGAENVYSGARKSMGFLGEEESDDKDAVRERYMSDLKKTFRPEFLNRVDDIIVFDALAEDDIIAIADLLLRELEDRLEDQHITVTISDEAKKYLAEKGYDKVFGARPLRRTILTKIEDPLAEKLLDGSFGEGDRVKVDLAEGELVFSKEEEIAAEDKEK